MTKRAVKITGGVFLVALFAAVLTRNRDVTVSLNFQGAACRPTDKSEEAVVIERRARLEWHITNNCEDAIRVCMARWRSRPGDTSRDDEGPVEDADQSEGMPKLRHCTNVSRGGRDTIKGRIKATAAVGQYYYDVTRAVGSGSMERVDPMIDIVRFRLGPFKF
jgi:hypothetical protein